jgi:hypothetical protein
MNENGKSYLDVVPHSIYFSTVKHVWFEAYREEIDEFYDAYSIADLFKFRI